MHLHLRPGRWPGPHPDSHDTLLADAEVPAIFPYGGSGSLLVAGELSRDGQTFFAQRIAAFSPELRRRFYVPLRQCDFYDDRALCRDLRRKLELWLDPAARHTLWNRTWNQWKYLLGTKIEVEGTFVRGGKYRKRHGEWELVTWETALPKRMRIGLDRLSSRCVPARDGVDDVAEMVEERKGTPDMRPGVQIAFRT